ncbi:MAG: DUF1830 domain-containing protein, partial [Tolypothrix sp. T3-bin4]|nr:DUF1830 domain-containing protein [Tolypothrix sp. T3-bin4]
VFPGQRLVFEAPKVAHLEIHTGMMASAILSDTIPCDRLALDEPSSNEFGTDSETGIDPINKKNLMQTINTKIGDTTQSFKMTGLVSVD